MVELAELLSPRRIALDLRPGSRRQLFREIAALVAPDIGVDVERIVDALLEREKLGTTAIGGGIAIPHAKLPELDRMVGAFARLAEPVDFEALDGKPVDLVFVLLAPENASAEHLKALARLARLLRDPALCERLRREQDIKRLHAALTGRAKSQAA
ncbi:Nitrogen regulatory protein [bacterium HR40]|nr:Nitrogen regulatory protein [bacterium HR40]